MPISILNGFNVTSANPADLKTIVPNSASLAGIASSWRYNGMLVYSVAEAAEWRLIGGIADSNWVKLSNSGSVIYATTASYISGSISNAVNSISSSYSVTSSYSLNGGGSGTTLITASTYPITSSWALTSSYLIGYSNPTFVSYSLSSSFASQSLSSSYLIGYTPPFLVSSSVSSSFASSSISASYLIGYSIPTFVSYSLSSSFASSSISSSYANNATTASYLTGYSIPTFVSASLSSSFASQSISSSYLIGYSIPFLVSSSISSSFASQSLSSSYLIGYTNPTFVSYSLSSSFASQSISSSYVPNLYPQTYQASGSWASQSLFSTTSSYSISSSYEFISVYSITSSFATQSLSSSYANSASYLIGYSIPFLVSSSVSSSFASQSLSSSYLIGYTTPILVSSSLTSVSSSFASQSLSSSYLIGYSVPTFVSYSLSSSFASSSISSSYSNNASTASYLLGYTVPFLVSSSVSSSFASQSLSASYVSSSNIIGIIPSSSYSTTSSYSLTASYVSGQVTATTQSFIISPNNLTFVSASSTSISGTVAGLPIFTVITQSSPTLQTGTGSLLLNANISSSNINVGVPNNSYQWGPSLVGSYFSSWNSNTNVSDMLRFFAGAFSASYPSPTPNTKTLGSVTLNNNLGGSTVTINGYIPYSSSNANINYLQPLGWANVGNTIFQGYTFKNGTGYVYYSSNTAGSTTVSSSLGANAFGLGLLTTGNITTVDLSGSFLLTFVSSSAGSINYTSSSVILMSQATQNLATSIATPIAVNSIPSANVAVIPAVYEDGYFNNFTGSNLTNSISLLSVSSSGLYAFSGSVGINSGSSPYQYFTPAPLAYYYTPIADGNFTQTITSPGSSLTQVTAVSRSFGGVPYLTNASGYHYVITASGAFAPLYLSGTVSTTTIPGNTLTLSTTSSTTLTTNPTIQTAGLVRSSSLLVARATGTYPYESDLIVFDFVANTGGTGTTAAASGSSLQTFTISNTTYNRANSGTGLGSQTIPIHVAGTFGQPVSSGSLLYFGRADGYTTSSLTFGLVSNTEQFLDETNRINLTNSVLTFSGSSFVSASYISGSDLQVKPGFLVNSSATGSSHTGYWYPTNYGTNYKYYIRHFQANAVVNVLQIVLTGVSNLVSWADTSTINSMAVALIFESGDANKYTNCRVYDVYNTAQNLIQSNVTSTNQISAGTNPFSSNIDLYGNNGSGASVAGSTILFPMRSADGAILDSTNAGRDELYVIVRYNGTPTNPLTNIILSKSS